MDAELARDAVGLLVGLGALAATALAALLLRRAVVRAALSASARRLQSLESQLHGLAREVLLLKGRTDQHARAIRAGEQQSQAILDEVER